MELDLVIRGGTVIDGSGQPGKCTDVGVSGERISAVGELGAVAAEHALDATGLVVAPGFIDIHTHSEYSLLLDPRGESKVRQGVTTEVVSNCSYAPYPIRSEDIADVQAQRVMHGGDLLDWDWNDLEGYRRRFNEKGAAINVAPLAGHAAFRVMAMGYDDRPPTTVELATMRRLLAETMEQGAFGFSAGLTLAPSGYADTDELVALCEVAGRYGGYYAAHMRVYAGQQLDARHETLEIARRAPISVQMSHNNVMFRKYWHLVPEILDLLDQESAKGVDVTYDVYPYLAGMSIVDQLMPGWAQEGGVNALLERLRDPATRQRVYDELSSGWGGTDVAWDWDAIRLTNLESAEHKDWEGQTVGQVAEQLGIDGLDALLTLTEHRASATFHHLSEANTRLLLQHPLGMVGSDGNAVTIGTPSLDGKPHPRFFGTFPRVLGRYVRQEGVLTLEEAVRKMTSAPAERLGLDSRGLLATGHVADIVVFDPATITDHATFDAPNRYSTGVHSVTVAGQLVLEAGEMTDALPGRALAH